MNVNFLKTCTDFKDMKKSNKTYKLKSKEGRFQFYLWAFSTPLRCEGGKTKPNTLTKSKLSRPFWIQISKQRFIHSNCLR